MSSIKHRVGSIANRLGYHLIPDWRLARIHFSNHLKDIFKKYGINCVLDVGANVGQYGEFLRHEVDFKGTIISFEPVSETYKALSKRAEHDHDWIVLNYAIGESDGETEINLMASSRLSSFLEPHSAEHILPMNVVVRKEVVTVRRLESLREEISKYSAANYFLKMDTQGFDQQAFLGAGNFSSQIAALQSEMSVIPIYSGMPNYLDSLQFFQKSGYALSGMYPVSHNDALKLVEFDCVMVRN